MQTKQAIDTLKLFHGNEISIKLFNDTFGVYVLKLSVWDFNVVGEDLIKIGKDIIRCDNILNIEIELSEEERIELIRNASSLKDAFLIGKNYLSPPVQDALEIARAKFSATEIEQMASLLSEIQAKLTAKRSKLTADSVLEHLCVNIIGKGEIVATLPKEVFTQIRNQIDKIIIKMEKEIF